jgi:MFS transporter, PAT family, beta-lactamase induction signal transducer AmpG
MARAVVAPELFVESSPRKKKAGLGVAWAGALWVSTTYFAEGFPYAIVNSLVEVLFRDLGASLGAVGLTSLFHLPWNLKFLWAPWMERMGRMRTWIWLLELGLAFGFLVLGVGLLLQGQTALPRAGFMALSGGVLLLAILSASHDVAIDGHYLGALGATEQAQFLGLRAGAYKVASVLARGPLLLAIDVFGWSAGMLLIGGFHAVLGWVHWRLLPRGSDGVDSARTTPSSPRPKPVSVSGAESSLFPPSRKNWGASVSWLFVVVVTFALLIWFRTALGVSGGVSLGLVMLVALGLAFRRSPLWANVVPVALEGILTRPRMTTALLFVLTFRLGESFQQKMKWPFLSEVMHLSKADYSTLNGTLGVLAGFFGVLVGGALISRSSLQRWFWPFVLAQNTLNLLYAGLAFLPSLLGQVNSTEWRWVTGAVIVIDEWGSGLGNAVLMVYLMRLVRGEHKPSEYAFVTALMSFGFTVAGATSGFFAEGLGYVGFFVLSFVLTFPMMALAPRALGALHQAGDGRVASRSAD